MNQPSGKGSASRSKGANNQKVKLIVAIGLFVVAGTLIFVLMDPFGGGSRKDRGPAGPMSLTAGSGAPGTTPTQPPPGTTIDVAAPPVYEDSMVPSPEEMNQVPEPAPEPEPEEPPSR